MFYQKEFVEEQEEESDPDMPPLIDRYVWDSSESEEAFVEEQEEESDPDIAQSKDLPTLIDRQVSDSSESEDDAPTLIDRQFSDSSESEDDESEDDDNDNIDGQRWQVHRVAKLPEEGSTIGCLYDKVTRKYLFYETEHFVECGLGSIQAIQLIMKDKEEKAKLKKAIVEFPNLLVDCEDKKNMPVSEVAVVSGAGTGKSAVFNALRGEGVLSFAYESQPAAVTGNTVGSLINTHAHAPACKKKGAENKRCRLRQSVLGEVVGPGLRCQEAMCRGTLHWHLPVEQIQELRISRKKEEDK